MHSFILCCQKIIRKFAKDEITVYAAQASFFIVIASFPFIMLLITLLQILPPIDQQAVNSIITTLLPDTPSVDLLIDTVLTDIYTHSPGTVLSITAVTAIWSASLGMLSVERGLNRIFGINHKRRNFIINRIICVGYTIVFMIMCILSLFLLVLGSAIQEMVSTAFPILANTANYIISIRTLLAMTILTIFFTFLYTYVPFKKQKLRKQLPGAMITTICWIIFSFLFSIYFNNFSNFSYMYGSLTAVVLLMLWLYECICILFFGAEINYILSLETEHSD